MTDNKIKIIVLTLWTGVFFLILLTDNYTKFLKPSFGWVLLTGAVFFLFMLRMVLSEKANHKEEFFKIRSLIIILPVIFFIFAREGSLNSDTFKKKNMYDLPGSAVSTKEDKKTQEQYKEIPEDPEEDAYGLPSPVIPEKEVKNVLEKEKKLEENISAAEMTITEVHRLHKKLIGKKLMIIGKTMKYEKVSSAYGENAGLVYRFVITCCAADAMPLAVVVVQETPFKWENDVWVKAAGVFKEDKKDGLDVYILDKAVLEKTDKPKQEYVW